MQFEGFLQLKGYPRAVRKKACSTTKSCTLLNSLNSD